MQVNDKQENGWIDCPLCLGENAQLHLEKIDPHHGKRTYWKCSSCNLIYLSPAQHLNPRDEKARYDTHENSPENAGYIQFLKKLADPLCLKLQPGFVGLDYGCGPGPTLGVILHERGYAVENYDPYYFPDDSLLKRKYDFVTCTEVIEHLYCPRKEFQLIDRLLKEKGSYVGLMTEILECDGDFQHWWYHRDPTHVCFYQPETFEWMAKWMSWAVEFPARNVIIFSK